jgi:hydroxymethylbilane synthase
MTPVELKLGTRGSALALTQSQWVADQIHRRSGGVVTVSLQIIRTRGDQIQDKPLPEIGGKGLFTQELEDALRAGAIHLAVHSLKDLPTEGPADLTLGAYPAREDPRDALIGGPLMRLPPGARVGTGSARRAAQLLAARPDLRVEGIRGNVDTRLRKQREGVVDAVMLAPGPVDLHPGAGARHLGCAVPRRRGRRAHLAPGHRRCARPGRG